MALVTNSNDQIPAATTPTTGNSGGGGDTAYSNVNIVTGSDLVSSTTQKAHGAQALALGGTNGIAYVGWNGYSSTSMSMRTYFYPVATPSVAGIVMQMRTTGGINIVLNASGQLAVQDLTPTTTVLGNITTLYNTWIRIDFAGIRGSTTGNGTIKAQYYAGDLTTVHGTCTPLNSTTSNTGTSGNITETRTGRMTGTFSGTAYLDDLAANDGTTAFIDPIGARIPFLSPGLAAVQRACTW